MIFFPVTTLGEEKLEELLKEKNYDFIGFTVLGPTLPYDIQLTHKVKTLQEKAVLVAGGAVPTADPQLLKESAVDFVIKGWGEDPLLNLVVKKNKRKRFKRYSRCFIKR